MDSFSYKNEKLFAEGVDVAAIAAEVGTPVYVYSKATFLDHLTKIQNAYAEIDPFLAMAAFSEGYGESWPVENLHVVVTSSVARLTWR